MTELYIGLMSGTSIDGIDAALVSFEPHPKLIATYYVPYSALLKQKILGLCQPGSNEIIRLGELDILLAKEFATAVKMLLQQEKIQAEQIKAIGSHGQTIRHYPQHPEPFTMQIGDPNTIAALTGITTIADFRRKDIAHGGQGAPLVPAFHRYLIPKDTINRAIVNIGGIANVTILREQQPVIGFDTGPGNVLLDAWIALHQQKTYDKNGEWAAQGNVSQALLTEILTDSYFSKATPKSTGREYFNLQWLQKYLMHKNIAPIDVQCTLAELTAQTILQSIRHYFSYGEIIICGGGAHNAYLMSRLQKNSANNFTLTTSEKFGIHPDWMEAVAFAWLAYQTLNRKPGNLPSVTGAKLPTVLGGIYYSN